MMEIASIDHFVLTVRSLTETCAFYERVLGMKAAEFGPGRWSLSFGRQKINLHQVGKEFEPRARTAQPGTGDFCLVSGDPLEAVVPASRERRRGDRDRAGSQNRCGRADHVRLHPRPGRQPRRDLRVSRSALVDFR